MEAQDYRNSGLIEDGILKGIGVSVFAHVMAFMLAWSASWLMPLRKVEAPLHTVNLLSVEDLRGGGDDGAMGKGNGELQSAEGPAAIPPTSGPEAAPEPEPEKTDTEQLSEVVEDTVSLVPVLPKVEKPVEKQKPKPKPKPMPKPPQKQQTVAKTETPPPTASETKSATLGPPDGAVSSDGQGPGRPDAEGDGKLHTGRGPGGGHGPYDMTFGSGEGPRFVTKVVPRYPRLARELGQEGIVLLMVIIDEKGHLVDAEVIKGAGSGFDEEALRAAKSSTFSPAKHRGRPVLCKARLPILFKLQGQ